MVALDFNLGILDETKLGIRDLKRIPNDLSQVVDKATHIHPTPTPLDLAATNLPSVDSSIEVLPDAIADHQPVIFRAKVGRQHRPRSAHVSTRAWKRVDWNALCLLFLKAD